MIPNRIVLLFLLFFEFFVALAQEPQIASDSLEANELEEAMITATRTQRKLSSLPLPATIITAKEIQAMNAVRLTDILSEQTGLVSVPDFGGVEGIQLQGFDSQYTLILIDGAPLVGRSAGTFDLNRISAANIKQIEIVKGPSSALYGNEALGGVINIITKDPEPGFKNQINYRVGEFASNDLSVSTQYKKGKFGISAVANRYSTAGYDLDKNIPNQTVESFHNHTFNLKTTYAASAKTDLTLSGRYFTAENKLNPTPSSTGENTIDEWNVLFLGKHEFNAKWSTQLELYASQYVQDEFLNDGISDELLTQREFDQWFLRPELRLVHTLNTKHNFIVGMGITRETLDRIDFLQQAEFNAPYLYAQWDWNPTKQLNVIAGARFDSHNVYESQLSPKLAARYNLLENLAVKASFGYGYKAPDFRQLYFDFLNAAGGGYIVLGYNAVLPRIAQLDSQGLLNSILVPLSNYNNNLNAENSTGLNLGLDYNLSKKLQINLNIFRNDVQDLIDTQIIAQQTNGANIFSYFNVNESYTQGLEFNASWKPIRNLKINAGYQLLYAKDKEAERNFKDGRVFARDPATLLTFSLDEEDYFGLFNRSRHNANLRIFYNFIDLGLDANIRGTYRSKFGLFDSNGNTYLDDYDEFVDAYSIWDFAINKKLWKHSRIGFGMDNVFNFTDPQNITNIPGRIVYANLNLQF